MYRPGQLDRVSPERGIRVHPLQGPAAYSPPVAMRLIALGEVMLDVASPALVPGRTEHAPIRVRAGGSPVTAAAWAAAAGIDATVIGRVGADPAGQAVRASLVDAGIEARLATDAGRPTGTFLEAGAGPGRAIVADRGANACLETADLGELRADAILVSGYVLLHDDTLAAGRAALERGVADWLAVDAASPGLVTRLGPAEVLARTAGANAIFANAEEARALTGLTGAAAAAALAPHFRLVCVKSGPEGAIAVLDGVTVRAAPPERVAQPIAGPGDALAGVLLAGLVQGLGLPHSLERACVAAARAAGGTSPRSSRATSPLGAATPSRHHAL
jgi:2-dehydro-3-deoxygluconokinase